MKPQTQIMVTADLLDGKLHMTAGQVGLPGDRPISNKELEKLLRLAADMVARREPG